MYGEFLFVDLENVKSLVPYISCNLFLQCIIRFPRLTDERNQAWVPDGAGNNIAALFSLKNTNVHGDVLISSL